jgi:ABC-2 type transport system permease protein
MNAFRLLIIFLRVGILGELAYRAQFFLQLFQSLVELATSLAGLAVVFSYTDRLGDWSPDEVLALVGVYFMVGGLIGFVIQPGMEQLIESIRDGSLDFLLTKPEDGQLLASIQRVDAWAAIDVFLGAFVLGAALLRMGTLPSPGEAASFAVMLVAGGIILYSTWILLASLSFWFVRVENILEIFNGMYQAARWPLSLYPGWLRFALTFILPVAFATTIPVEALTGRLGVPSLIGAIGLAIFLLMAARVVWSVGIRRYSGASA